MSQPRLSAASLKRSLERTTPTYNNLLQTATCLCGALRPAHLAATCLANNVHNFFLPTAAQSCSPASTGNQYRLCATAGAEGALGALGKGGYSLLFSPAFPPRPAGSGQCLPAACREGGLA